MCGAGTLPARMAMEARRQGWRVVALVFGDSPGVGVHAERVIPSRLTELGAVLQALTAERVAAVLLAGKFWAQDVLGARRADATFVGMAARAGALTEVRMLDVIVTKLQKRQPPRIRSFRRKRSQMTPASGAPAAYTHMNAEPINPSCSLLNPNSSLSFGKTPNIAWRSA